jgi:hypothetical protein
MLGLERNGGLYTAIAGLGVTSAIARLGQHVVPRKQPKHHTAIGLGQHGLDGCRPVSCPGQAKLPGYLSCPRASGHMTIYRSNSPFKKLDFYSL